VAQAAGPSQKTVTRRRFVSVAALAFVACYALIFGSIALVHWPYPGFRRDTLAVLAALMALGAAGLVVLGYWWHEAFHDRRIARQLDENARRLRLLANHVPCAIWTTDANLIITSAVGALMQPFGWPPERAIGQSYPEMQAVLGPDDPGVLAHRRALAGETTSYERVLKGRSLEVRVDPLKDETGAVVGCVGVAVEYTKWAGSTAQGGARRGESPV
jgi:PAS domain S-box-containing protein